MNAKTAIFFATSLVSTSLAKAETISFDTYKDICLSAATDDNVFKDFKVHPHYTRILEHINQQFGQEYLDFIASHYPYLIEKFEQFRANDALGSPVVYDFPIIGRMGTTTLRYVKVLGDLEAHIGNLDGMRIIEIGAGYGGQCLTISKAHKFAEYQIVDLKEAQMLTEKYLSLHKVPNFRCMDPDKVPADVEYDLVISNYAFSEFVRSVQELYLERIIRHAKHGYLTVNFLNEAAAAGRYTLEELSQKLTSFGFNPQVLPEVPLTGRDNRIVIW